jgi:hypothetical protein
MVTTTNSASTTTSTTGSTNTTENSNYHKYRNTSSTSVTAITTTTTTTTGFSITNVSQISSLSLDVSAGRFFLYILTVSLARHATVGNTWYFRVFYQQRDIEVLATQLYRIPASLRYPPRLAGLGSGLGSLGSGLGSG